MESVKRSDRQVAAISAHAFAILQELAGIYIVEYVVIFRSDLYVYTIILVVK